jgi:hypothetical protein
MTAGLLYEPRALWSLARIESGASQPRRPPFTVRLPRDHFLNGEKYPITITKALVCPVNYQADTYRDNGPFTAANFRNDGVSAVERTRLVISAPQRQYYMRQPGHPQGLTPRPSYTPVPPGASFGTPDGVSSLWGLSRWKFDKPMLIPKLGDLEFDLSAITSPANIPGVVAGTLEPRAYVHFEETRAGLFNGNSRDTERLVMAYYGSGGSAAGAPFPSDGFGFNAVQGGPILWPPTTRFSARRYGAENPTSDGSIPVTGFSVLIDQIQYDDGILGAPWAAILGSVISPLSLRVACRARMRNGGTGAYWWRDGAPLALVCPTITPAQVYDLPEPITLGPGERLDVEVSAPGPVVIGENAIPSIYQIGVGLCGYASIEA